MASDGIWDELDNDDISKIVGSVNGKMEDIPNAVLFAAMDHAFKTSHVSMEQYKKMNENQRRNTHDDLTVMVIKL